MSLQLILIALVFLMHILVASFGSVVVSTIPIRFLPRKNIHIFLCWIVPFFAALFIVYGGRYVPALGCVSFSAAMNRAQLAYESELLDVSRKDKTRDSGHGVGAQSSQHEVGDGGE